MLTESFEHRWDNHRRRPMPFVGAVTLPKHFRFERMVLTERGVQWAALAICALV